MRPGPEPAIPDRGQPDGRARKEGPRVVPADRVQRHHQPAVGPGLPRRDVHVARHPQVHERPVDRHHPELLHARQRECLGLRALVRAHQEPERRVLPKFRQRHLRSFGSIRAAASVRIRCVAAGRGRLAHDRVDLPPEELLHGSGAADLPAPETRVPGLPDRRGLCGAAERSPRTLPAAAPEAGRAARPRRRGPRRLGRTGPADPEARAPPAQALAVSLGGGTVACGRALRLATRAGAARPSADLLRAAECDATHHRESPSADLRLSRRDCRHSKIQNPKSKLVRALDHAASAAPRGDPDADPKDRDRCRLLGRSEPAYPQ